MWSKEIASIWKNYKPPCRPSEFEIDSCIQIVTSNSLLDKENIKVLILGSTTEYREMCAKQNWTATIIDNSLDYHLEISKEIKVKNLKEELVNTSWQEICFDNTFDLIVGDLVIGNLHEIEIHDFLKRIQKSLKPGGIIITKSVFFDIEKPIVKPSVFFRNYENHFNHLDPFQFNAYNLTTYAMDIKTNILLFYRMFEIVAESFNQKLISEKTFKRYQEFGWQDALKTEFYVMPINKWEDSLTSTFSNFSKRYAPYFWAKDFPFYIINK